MVRVSRSFEKELGRARSGAALPNPGLHHDRGAHAEHHHDHHSRHGG